MAEIVMPQLGETVTEGTITRWMKKVGDPVLQDEVLFEVSTDKVDSEVPSSASGFLTQILVQEGETVDVGTAIAVVESEAGATPPQPVAATPPPQPVAETPPPAPVAATPPPQPVVETPPPAPITYMPPPAAVTPPPPQPVAATPPPQPAVETPASSTDALLLSPVVRKLINENGLDPADIDGTGAGGRVTRSDVLNYLDRSGPRPQRGEPAQAVITTESRKPEPTTAPPAPAAQTHAPAAQTHAPAVRAGARDEVIPFDNIRRRTAEHMVRSKATSAHTLVAIEVDFEAVEKVRRDSGATFKAEEGFSLTYLPFVARAVIEAMRNYPKVNASVGDDSLIVHKDVNLSIAVDLNLEGLIAPVVHNADTKR
ncbi:MAG: dihydrolipoyllysine-residue succinyltransferase, partial [Acidimicrobiaceae bacterium]|nr:dihydrolipoyllysine-residue succinyltransferase [Acidimicrobiaceae bacterium]